MFYMLVAPLAKCGASRAQQHHSVQGTSFQLGPKKTMGITCHKHHLADAALTSAKRVLAVDVEGFTPSARTQSTHARTAFANAMMGIQER
jgi:hypothetical protein